MNADGSAFCQKCGADLKVAAPVTATSSQGNSSSSSSKKASFRITSAFSGAIELVKNPTGFMNANREGDIPLKTLMINYVAVLAVVPLVATLIGDTLFYGIHLAGYAIAAAVLTYILDIVAVFVVGFVIWKLAPNFGTSTTQARATRIAAYAFTPVFLLAIFDIIPIISAITILGLLYGLYILYLGFPILLNTPKDKVMSYLIVTLIATLVVFFVIGAIIGAITSALFLVSVGLL